LIGYVLHKKTAPNQTESRPRLGFIGVGKMGGPIARRLLADDHDVTVYDVSSAALRPLVKLGARADIVCTCLPTLEGRTGYYAALCSGIYGANASSKTLRSVRLRIYP